MPRVPRSIQLDSPTDRALTEYVARHGLDRSALFEACSRHLVAGDPVLNVEDIIVAARVIQVERSDRRPKPHRHRRSTDP